MSALPRAQPIQRLRTVGDLIVDHGDGAINAVQPTLIDHGIGDANARQCNHGGVDAGVGADNDGATSAEEDAAGLCAAGEQDLAVAEEVELGADLDDKLGGRDAERVERDGRASVQGRRGVVAVASWVKHRAIQRLACPISWSEGGFARSVGGRDVRDAVGGCDVASVEGGGNAGWEAGD